MIEKINNMIGIYKITSPTNKVYIGQSIDIDKRWGSYKRLSCKSQPRLYNSLLKYGVDQHKFEVLIDFDREVSEEYLTHCEQFFMDFYRDEGFELMNLRDAGPKGKPSEETRKKMSEAQLGEKNYWFGKKQSQEHINKRPNMKGEKNPNYGKKASDETRQKQSESQKQLYKSGYIHPMLGKKLKEEQIEKMSVCILQFDLEDNFIAEHKSIHEAGRNTNTIYQNISKCCKGERKTAGGYKWFYKK